MITTEQRDARIHHIGGSDAPVIAGEIGSRYDLFLEKTGRLASKRENDAMEVGSYLERGVLDYAEAKLGIEIRRDLPTLVHRDGIRAANLDGLAMGAEVAIVEAKTSGAISGRVFEAELWGEPWSDQVPPRVLVQCQHNLTVASDHLGGLVEKAYVPAFLVGRGIEIFVVRHSDRLAALLAELETEFWASVAARIAPEDSAPTLEAIKRWVRAPGRVAPVTDEAMQRWLRARKQVTAWTKEKDAAFAGILAEMGDAEVGESPSLGRVTYFEEKREAYPVDAKTFRVARHKAVK